MSLKFRVFLVAILGLTLSASPLQIIAPIRTTTQDHRGPPPFITVANSTSLLAPPPSILTTIDGIREPSGAHDLAPDPQVATGPTSIVEMANTNVEVFSKQGVSLKNSTFTSFFNVSLSKDLGDPRVLYDALSARWFATLNVLILAVSTSIDPTASWRLYNFTLPCAGDQPSLGVNDDKVVTSSNLSSQAYSRVCIFDKSELVTGALTIDFTALNLPYPSVHPVQSLSFTGTEYMVSTGLSPTNVTRLYSISPSILGHYRIQETNLTTAPITQPSNSPFDAFDSRVQDATWFKGNLWYALNDGCRPPSATLTLACIRLTEINTNNTRVVQDFDYGVNNQNLYYPALRIDEYGNLNVIFGFSSAIAITGQNANDPVNTLRQPVIIKTGKSPGLLGRWGDYFGAGVDPTDPRVVWVAGEYIPNGEPNLCINEDSQLNVPCWATFVASISVQSFSMSISPASLNMTAPAPGGMRTASATLTLTSLAFSGQITLSNNPNYETAISGPLLAYSQTSFNMALGQTVNVVVSLSICSSTPSRTFTIIGTSAVFTGNVTFTVNVTGQRSGSCPS